VGFHVTLVRLFQFIFCVVFLVHYMVLTCNLTQIQTALFKDMFRFAVCSVVVFKLYFFSVCTYGSLIVSYCYFFIYEFEESF
jgi:hypothetical protein